MSCMKCEEKIACEGEVRVSSMRPRGRDTLRLIVHGPNHEHHRSPRHRVLTDAPPEHDIGRTVHFATLVSAVTRHQRRPHACCVLLRSNTSGARLLSTCTVRSRGKIDDR